MNAADKKALRDSAKVLADEAESYRDSYRVGVPRHPQFGTFDTGRDGQWAKRNYEKRIKLAAALRLIALTRNP